MCAHVNMCAHMHGGQRAILGVVFGIVPISFVVISWARLASQ